jgi:hypothetical protein
MLCLRAYAIPYIVVDSAVTRYNCIIDTLTDTLTVENNAADYPRPGANLNLVTPSWSPSTR